MVFYHLLPADPLIQSLIVDFHQLVFERSDRRRVIFRELQISQQVFQAVIIFMFEVSSFGSESNWTVDLRLHSILITLYFTIIITIIIIIIIIIITIMNIIIISVDRWVGHIDILLMSVKLT